LNRGDFQALAQIRLVEAKTLLDTGRFDGAYYLAGYAVECALKACISRLTREFDFPPDRRSLENIYTHNLVRLVAGTGWERCWRIKWQPTQSSR
jgi:HEPN domain-containing protein